MSHDTWIHKIARAAIVRPLAKTSVTPNQVTTVRLIAGVGAAMAVAHGGVELAHYGAVLFILSMLLDRADGDLARMTGRTSPGGHTYDLFADAFCNALIFIGLGIGLRFGDFRLGSILLGFIAGGAIAAILVLVIRIENLQGARAAEIVGLFGFDPDDAMLLIPIAILMGWSEWLLLAAAIGAPAFAVFFLFMLKKRLRNERAS